MSGAMLFGGIFLGLAVLLNFIFIVHKFKTGRPLDAVVDIGIIIVASAIYGTSIMGGVIATIGSMFISIYLHYVPLNLFTIKETKKKDSPEEDEAFTKRWADKIDSLFE